MLSCPPATTISESPLKAERDGAQPRTAHLVDRVSRRLDRDAGANRGLPRRVHAFAGREDLAEDDFRYVLRLDMGAAQRLGDRDLAQFVGRQGREAAIERADRGADGAGDDDVGSGHCGIS
jgi:hypothetical protein